MTAPASLPRVGMLATVRNRRGLIRDKGIEAFCARNDGDGWKPPESLRLADYGLGHDERAQSAQPVASRLGERFLPWQLEQSVEASWAEREEHAKKLLGEEGFARPMAEIGGETTTAKEAPVTAEAEATNTAASPRLLPFASQS